MVTVSEEKSVDYELTAKIATEAFDQAHVHFSPDRIKWLYEESFGQGTTVLAAIDDGRKIGQIALVGQKLSVNGEVFPALQLVDLFILQAYRSAQLVRRLYKEVDALCAARGIRYLLALPNDKSVLLNARFLKLSELLWMKIRAGVSLREPASSKLRYSGPFKAMTRVDAEKLFSGFSGTAGENGLHWDAETLAGRLADPTRDYAVHATENLLLISSTRKTLRLTYTALCAFFARPQAKVADDEVSQLVRAACRFWNKPVFVYAGSNDRLPKLPGVAVPVRLRQPILVQFRDIKSDASSVRFDRFQLIDSDFA
jgi:Acetyltransferase (GNAT) domain